MVKFIGKYSGKTISAFLSHKYSKIEGRYFILEQPNGKYVVLSFTTHKLKSYIFEQYSDFEYVGQVNCNVFFSTDDPYTDANEQIRIFKESNGQQ